MPVKVLGDGTLARAVMTVRHRQRPEAGEGEVRWYEWRGPNGEWVKVKDRYTPGTGIAVPRLRPGAWHAVVSWGDLGAHRRQAPGTDVSICRLIDLEVAP